MSIILFFLLISIGINLVLFVPAFIFKTDKLTDFGYALTFILLSTIALLYFDYSFLKLMIYLMVNIWALRLGVFLLIRISRMKKDSRFDDKRDNFFKFLSFWLLQALTAWIILIPYLLFLYLPVNKFYFIGTLIWLIGLIIEAVSDFQKFNFKNDPNNKDRFIDSGLWKYSRHPNYFGEILCWIGVYIFTLASLNLVQGLIALISPLFITILLLFVSGIPLLEKAADRKWSNNSDYLNYKKTTNILIPWILKRSKTRSN